MPQDYKLTYHVDLVFCIDATGSMRHIIDMVKNNALKLYQDVADAMAQKHKTIQQMRVRVIAFRDYIADGEDAMRASGFFVLPEEAAAFQQCVIDIDAKGGGDIPEDGLEALGYAIRSDWTREGVKKRHIIVLWSDAPTHDIGFAREVPWYPAGMAQDFEELTNWWEDEQLGGMMDGSAKRLLMFAPDAPAWNQVSTYWPQVIHVKTVSDGLEDVEYHEVIDMVCNTI